MFGKSAWVPENKRNAPNNKIEYLLVKLYFVY